MAMPSNRRISLVRRVFAGFGLTAAVLLLVAATLFFAARQPPDFYRQSLTQFSGGDESAGEELEQQALAVHNQLQHEGRFEARFSVDEINGWLANELPAKFPRLLPAAFSEPRIALEEDLLRLAVGYRRGNLQTVLSIAVEAYLTEQPNEVAIRIRHARAGLVPVPLGKLLEDIKQRAERAGIVLRWSEIQGDPVALVRVRGDGASSDGSNDKGDRQRFTLEELRLIPGELMVIGRTEQSEATEQQEFQMPAAIGQSPETATRQR